MRETNLSAGFLQPCRPWSVESPIPLFLPPSTCDVLKPLCFLLVPVSMNEVRLVSAVCNFSCFPKLLSKLSKAISNSVLHYLRYYGWPSGTRLDAGVWEVALLVVTKLILNKEWLGLCWCTLKCNLYWIFWVCNA